MTLATFAIPQESRGFRRAAGEAMERGDVCVAHTGIGAAAARRTIETLISQHRPRRIISAGFAGALDPGLSVGDVIIGENYSDAGWRTRIEIPAIRGVLLTVESPAVTVAEKIRLRAETGAVAVDMETSVIALACAAHGIPMLSLRAISDDAATALPIPFFVSWNMERQRPRPLAVALHLVRHPSRIKALRHFIADLSTARRALTVTLAGLTFPSHATGSTGLSGT